MLKTYTRTDYRVKNVKFYSESIMHLKRIIKFGDEVSLIGHQGLGRLTHDQALFDGFSPPYLLMESSACGPVPYYVS